MFSILVVSCYSVDINNSASIELIYYLNLLAESGEFKVHLLTMDFPKHSIYYDTNVSGLLHKGVVVHRVKGGFILNKMIPKNSINSKSNKNIKKLNSSLIKLKNIFNIIDPYLGWSHKAYKYFKKSLYDLKFDVILSMHEPPSSLICGHRIKKFVDSRPEDIRLVSYFSDPYCNELNRRSKNFIVRKINSVIERSVVNVSNGFLFVTESNLNYFVNKYNIKFNNVSLVHRNLSKTFINKFKRDYPIEFMKDKINFLYAGDIVKGVRDITKFVEALDYVAKNNIDVFSRLNINFYGNIKDDFQLELVEKSPYINFKNRISYLKIINFMIHADVLLIFGNKEFSQIPAKIYDYMATNAYILVILESYDDPFYKLIKNVDGIICTLNNWISISKTLVEFVNNVHDPKKNFERNSFDNNDILNKIKKVFCN